MDLEVLGPEPQILGLGSRILGLHFIYAVLESLLNKVAGCKFIKKRLQQRCFPVKFAKFLRKTSTNDCFWTFAVNPLIVNGDQMPLYKNDSSDQATLKFKIKTFVKVNHHLERQKRQP